MRLLRIAKGTWDVLAACDERGECQTLNLLMSFEKGDKKRRKHARALLAMLREYVPVFGAPKATERCEPLEDGIYAFRSPASQIRILWFYEKGRVIICTHAFLKPGQRLDRTQLDRAKRIRAGYQEALSRGVVEIVE